MKNFKAGNSISPWTKFLFCSAMFYMQNKGRGKAAKVVNFVAKWLNLCLSTVLYFYLTNIIIMLCGWDVLKNSRKETAHNSSNKFNVSANDF